MYKAETKIIINADIDLIWDYLTKPELVKKYFFNTNMVTTWKVGDEIFFRGEWEGVKYEDKGHVLEFNPPYSLAFDYWSSFSGVEDKPSKYQVIREELKEVPNGVEIHITQSNVETQEKADHSVANWNMVYSGLKKMLEERN